jgi:hypothetical protein
MKTTEDMVNEPSLSDILVPLGCFLAWATEEGAFHGGYSGKEALTALQQLLGWDDVKMTHFVSIFVQDEEP